MKKTTKSESYQQSFSVVKDRVSEIRDLVASQMQGAALILLNNLFKNEVEELCGSVFSRKNGELCHRAGNDPGSVILQGQRIRVQKPRVKGGDGEVPLTSYNALQDFDLLCDRIMAHMMSGVSTRKYDPLLDEITSSTGLKKSSVSKAFIMGSQQCLDELNSRDLSKHNFFSIMIDGLEIGRRTIIVAMGITDKGKKIILGLREGDTENSVVVKDLLANVIERGLPQEKTYLFVLDGSKALKKAVVSTFGENCFIQRCVRHKERNILKYLPKTHHGEFRRRWKLVHGSTTLALATLEFKRLREWLKEINYEALDSLEESGTETLTVIELQASKELRKSLLSTNPIESIIDMTKSSFTRVKNWKKGTNQIARWVATALLEAEKKVRSVRGMESIQIVMMNMEKKKQLQTQQGVA